MIPAPDAEQKKWQILQLECIAYQREAARTGRELAPWTVDVACGENDGDAYSKAYK